MSSPAQWTVTKQRGKRKPAQTPEDGTAHMKLEASQAPKRGKGPSLKTPASGRQDRTPLLTGGNRSAGTGQPYGVDERDVKQMERLIKQYKEEEAQKLAESNLTLGQTELDALVGKVVRMLLFKNFEKKNVPVPRQQLVDIIKAEYKDHKQVRHMPGVVIPSAQARMISVFGIEVKEVERGGADTKRKEDSGGTKCYVLRSAVPSSLKRRFVPVEGDEQRQGLMLVIATIVKFAGRVEESELWRSLAQFAVYKDEEHPVLGAVSDVIKQMLDMRYLIVSKKAGPEGPELVYELGECWSSEIPENLHTQHINAEIEEAKRIAPEQGDDDDLDVIE